MWLIRMLMLVASGLTMAVALVALTQWFIALGASWGIHMLPPVAAGAVLLAAMVLAYLSARLIGWAVRNAPVYEDEDGEWEDMKGE